MIFSHNLINLIQNHMKMIIIIDLNINSYMNYNIYLNVNISIVIIL